MKKYHQVYSTGNHGLVGTLMLMLMLSFDLHSRPTLTMRVNRELLGNENNPGNKTLHASLGSMAS
jgi:hypothetical protein